MAKCIYTKLTEHDTEFEKREHIFPAGIGGSKMLRQGDVSDYANEIFSKLELNFMRESIISLPRVLLGPGKRGSFSPKKRTKSKITIMKHEKEMFLGYMELAVPKTITQIHINYNEIKQNKKQKIRFNFSPGKNINESYTAFMKKITGSKYITINEPGLEKNNFIVGHHEKNIFVACNKDSEIEKFHNFLKYDFKVPEDLIENRIKEENLIINRSQPSVTLDLAFDLKNYSRVCGKIAFNALCYLKGPEFVLKKEFDKIRNFIIKGEGNYGKFVQLPGEKVITDVKEILKIGEFQHSVFFSKTRGNELCAILTLYGIDHMILLSDNYSDISILDGFICNWREKKETTLMERL